MLTPTNHSNHMLTTKHMLTSTRRMLTSTKHMLMLTSTWHMLTSKDLPARAARPHAEIHLATCWHPRGN